MNNLKNLTLKTYKLIVLLTQMQTNVKKVHKKFLFLIIILMMNNYNNLNDDSIIYL